MGWMLNTYIVVMALFALTRLFGLINIFVTVIAGILFIILAFPFGTNDTKAPFLFFLGMSIIFTLFVPVLV